MNAMTKIITLSIVAIAFAAGTATAIEDGNVVLVLENAVKRSAESRPADLEVPPRDDPDWFPYPP